MEKWAQIYHCAGQIKACDPWSRFREQDLFVWQPKDNPGEFFFSFLRESSGDCGIAFYENGNDCFLAQERLHGKNEKKEPVFLLQNAIVLLWSDRNALSKDSYQRIKALGLKFRGKGCWPHFQQYRIGFLPQAIPEEKVGQLLEQIESLLEMLRNVESNRINLRLDQNHVLLRSYQESMGAYMTYITSLRRHRRCLFRKIEMEESDWLRNLKQAKCRGTIAIDWAYCSGILDSHAGTVIPRLAMAVNTRSGSLLEKTLFTPETAAHEDLLKFLEYVIQRHGKPVSIEICDREMEAYLRSICDRTGIRLIMKPRLRHMEILRRAYLSELY